MDIERAVSIAWLVTELGSVRGRKRLQKIVHLLASAGHSEFKHRFILHYYGPFSRQVASELDFLVDAGFVKESGGEKGGYSYVAGDAKAAEALKTLQGDTPENPGWLGLAKELDKEDTDVLESASTLVYLHENGVTQEHLKSRFLTIKPHLKRQYQPALALAKERSLI